MTDTAPREFELKLELEDDAWESLIPARVADGFRRGPAEERRLVSTYFDTPDQALRAAGISLRIRETGGKTLQTVKLQTGVSAGISNPVEVESEVADATPQIGAIENKGVRKRLKKLIGGASLAPMFRTDVLRTIQILSGPQGAAELSVDRGSIVTETATAPISEAELELQSGDAQFLLSLAESLFCDMLLQFGQSSKSEQGYRLLNGEAAPVEAPLKAWQPDLDAGLDVGEVFGRIALSAAVQILQNWRALQVNDDPECAHQLRVGLRRMRSALRAFRPAIDNPDLRALGDRLRDAARIVGPLRDTDVLLADIVKPAFAPEAESAGALETLLAEAGAAERARVRNELDKPEWNGLLLRLAMLPHGALWQSGTQFGRIDDHAAASLQKCWKKVRKHARHLDSLSIEDRHRLRKDLKTLRYATEFFAPIFARKATRNFNESLKALLDRFGYLNDVALANTLPERIETGLLGTSDLQAEAQRSIGFVLGWHSAIAEAEWIHAGAQWDRLKTCKKFWK